MSRDRALGYLGISDAQARAAVERTRKPDHVAPMDKDKFLTIRVDAELHAKVSAAAARRNVSVSDYMRSLIEADLAASPGELGGDVRDALKRLVEAYQRSTAA
jgi:hypothetical protein